LKNACVLPLQEVVAEACSFYNLIHQRDKPVGVFSTLLTMVAVLLRQGN
jgi:hypothetical protein